MHSYIKSNTSFVNIFSLFCVIHRYASKGFWHKIRIPAISAAQNLIDGVFFLSRKESKHKMKCVWFRKIEYKIVKSILIWNSFFLPKEVVSKLLTSLAFCANCAKELERMVCRFFGYIRRIYTINSVDKYFNSKNIGCFLMNPNCWFKNRAKLTDRKWGFRWFLRDADLRCGPPTRSNPPSHDANRPNRSMQLC